MDGWRDSPTSLKYTMVEMGKSQCKRYSSSSATAAANRRMNDGARMAEVGNGSSSDRGDEAILDGNEAGSYGSIRDRSRVGNRVNVMTLLRVSESPKRIEEPVKRLTAR